MADASYKPNEVASLMQSPLLVGDVDYIVHNQGKTRIYMKGPAISRPVISRNGFSINEELMCALSMCTEKDCSNEITDDIVEDSYIKIRKNGVMSCTCPQCIEKHISKNPAWGNILIHDQAKAQSVGTLQ